MSVTRTKPAVLIDSISAGARSYPEVNTLHNEAQLGEILTSKRELHIKPMKLLSLAIWTASFTEIVVRPLL